MELSSQWGSLFLTTPFRASSGVPFPPVQWIPAALSPEVKSLTTHVHVQVKVNVWICTSTLSHMFMYEVCPESKDTKVLNMYNIFNLQKRHCE